MQLSVARRLGSHHRGGRGVWLLLGFGTGLAAGFLLTELVGAEAARRRSQRFRRPRPRQVARALERVREALSAEPMLRTESIELRPRSGTLELAGWVANRGARGLAWRVARAAAESIEIVNHLLVRGEDDRAADLEESPLSA